MRLNIASSFLAILLVSLTGCGADNSTELVFDASEHAKTTASPEEIERRMAEIQAGSKSAGVDRSKELKANLSGPN